MKQIFSLAITSLLLVSCTSTPTINELSQDGPTMRQLEERKVGARETISGNGQRVFKTFESDINKREISRYAERRVPNPELILIHLPRRDKHSGVIIPKYSSRFPMYDQVHYSLIREVDRNVN